jgi:hypothetical protein
MLKFRVSQSSAHMAPSPVTLASGELTHNGCVVSC